MLPNNQMEPTRSQVSRMMSPRRAAHLARYMAVLGCVLSDVQWTQTPLLVQFNIQPQGGGQNGKKEDFYQSAKGE
ncbi:MAG TPA: hypothetical protein VES88_16540, partial [Gemmatimonadaceae bacterium]|nr:hypothetical protein [Gemmatimonadaceae bacterium]